MPEPIQNSVPSRALARSLSLMGRVSLQLDDVVVPVAIVDDVSKALDRPAVGSGNSGAGGAGLVSHVQLLNPAGSGVLAYIEQALVSIGTTDTIQLRYHDTALATAITNDQWRDRRVAGRPACDIYHDNTGAGVGTLVAAVNRNADDALTFPLGLILPPGTGILFRPANNNIQVQAAFYWRERVLTPADLLPL